MDFFHYFICFFSLGSRHSDGPRLNVKLEKQGVKGFLLFAIRIHGLPSVKVSPKGSKELVKTYASKGIGNSMLVLATTCSHAHSCSDSFILSMCCSTFWRLKQRNNWRANPSDLEISDLVLVRLIFSIFPVLYLGCCVRKVFGILSIFGGVSS